MANLNKNKRSIIRDIVMGGPEIFYYITEHFKCLMVFDDYFGIMFEPKKKIFWQAKSVKDTVFFFFIRMNLKFMSH